MRITVITVCLTIVFLSWPFARRGEAQGRGERGAPPRGGGLANKVPELPAGAFTASSTVARTNLRHEGIDIPLENIKLGNQKTHKLDVTRPTSLNSRSDKLC